MGFGSCFVILSEAKDLKLRGSGWNRAIEILRRLRGSG
jgi:hypothetical protein